MATLADYTAAVYDVRMTQGDTFIEELVMEDSDGDAIDLSGYSFQSQIRDTPSAIILREFTISVTDNKVTRSLTAAETTDLLGTYVHDFQWTDPDGNIRTLLSGNFEAEAEVTR